MTTRRQFIKGLGALTGLLILNPLVTNGEIIHLDQDKKLDIYEKIKNNNIISWESFYLKNQIVLKNINNLIIEYCYFECDFDMSNILPIKIPDNCKNILISHCIFGNDLWRDRNWKYFVLE